MMVASYLRATTFAVEDRPAAPPRAGQVQIEVDYVGLCGTDRQIYRGALDARVGPMAIIGHEASGRIAALGEGVTGWEIGRRVTVLPLAWCGSCPACLADQPHLCDRLKVHGVDLPGALQELWNIPAELVVGVPASLSLEYAALAEPAAIAVHALSRAHIAAGDRVLVTDGGPVGLFIALFARGAGADVVVVERERHRRIVGVTAGVHMLDPVRDAVESYVQSWTAGRGVEAAFEVSGEDVGVAIAAGALAMHGRLVFVGNHDGPRGINLNRLIRRELALVGASRYEREDFERAVELLAEPGFPAALFVSSTEPLERLSEAFKALDSGGVMRILIALRG